MDQTVLPTNSPTVQSAVLWKRLAIRCFFGGAGFALVFAIIVGLVGWYNSRPKPPKPWNTNAIIASGPPAFGVWGDGKSIELSYSLQNTTTADYKVDEDTQIKLMSKMADGAFSPPLSKESASVTLPVFIPAGQKALLLVSLVTADIPQRNGGEADQKYHERLREYLQRNGEGVASFAIFDEANRYQLTLPKWLSEQPTKAK